MDMSYPVATVTIRGTSPYVQSKKHESPKLEGEAPDDYDIRTWRMHQHFEVRDGKQTVVMPAHGMHKSIVEAASRLGKIPGRGAATWTKVFKGGIMLTGSPSLGVHPDDAIMLVISANANGRPGAGTRVTRRFPAIIEWKTNFEVVILEPMITESVFSRCVSAAGLFVGIGMGRPENNGYNGRWVLEDLTWQDNRRLVA